MDQSRFLEIWGKVQSGEASPEEQLELNQHLRAHPEDSHLMEMMKGFWETPLPAKEGVTSDELDTAWTSFQENMTHKPGKIRHMTRWLTGVAAAAVIALTGLWWWKVSHAPVRAQTNTVSTRNGSRSKVDMPDGTQIWLNVGSRIHYDANYGKTNRDITLTGEAFFDVARDVHLPFIIHTEKLMVRVLGTSFNVKAYPGDETTEASLISGSIEVTLGDDPQKRLILKPHEKISVAGSRKDTVQAAPALVVSKVNYQPVDSTVIETAWVSNKLIFRGETFEALSKDIERWFNVTVYVRDSAILDRKFTGNFSNENITDVLEALSLTYPFRFEYNKNQNTVTITKH